MLKPRVRIASRGLAIVRQQLPKLGGSLASFATPQLPAAVDALLIVRGAATTFCVEVLEGKAQ